MKDLTLNQFSLLSGYNSLNKMFIFQIVQTCTDDWDDVVMMNPKDIYKGGSVYAYKRVFDASFTESVWRDEQYLDVSRFWTDMVSCDVVNVCCLVVSMMPSF